MPNLDERTHNLIEALFPHWAHGKHAMPAETFYQKMTTFGLVPDLKFVEAVTNICYAGRPRPAAQASIHTKERRKGAKRLGSAEGTQHDSQSNVSPRHEGASLRPGASCKQSQASARGRTRSASRVGHEGATAETIQSAGGVNKDGEEVCVRVNLQTFKALYGHGTEHKFVKLLFLLLKKHIARYVEHKNALVKSHLTAQKKKQAHSRSPSGHSDASRRRLRPQRHSLIEDLEYARACARRSNQEHRFYATALHCQMPKAIRSSMAAGFKVSQGLRKEKRGRDSGMSNSKSPAAGQQVAERGLRYSLRQYDELIHHLWRALDPEQKQEVSERAFFSFLREKKILTEKKQVDEMLRQCLFLKKGEEATIGATVPFSLYQRLFAKPLMLLGVENVLSLIEDSAHQ